MGESTYTRVDSLDLIRGVAILCILFMNVHSMAAPPIAYSVPLWREGTGSVDTIVYIAQSMLIESRFMTMFSLLFGVGLALQSDRMRARGTTPYPRLRRRMAWLLVFGLIHGFVLWSGDILALYALCGLIVMRVTQWSVRRLAIVGSILVAVGQLALLAALGGSLATGANIMEVPQLPFDAAALAASTATWTTFPARLVANAAEFLQLVAAFPVMLLWHSCGVMMIGIALYRRGFYTNPKAWKVGILLLAVGTLWSAFVLWLRFRLGITTSAGQSLLGLMLLAGLPCGIGYSSLLVPLAKRSGLIARALRNTGKTAFTLYLAQTVITLLIFVVIAPGLWGALDRATLTGYVVVLGAVQVVYAHRQQTRRGRGPLEQLWRTLAYRKYRAEGSS